MFLRHPFVYLAGVFCVKIIRRGGAHFQGGGVVMDKVRMTIHFPANYDEDIIDTLVEEKFPEADLWYGDREIRFVGAAERSQELLRAVEAVEKHDDVRITRC